MKKTKFALGLAGAAVCAISLAACSGVKPNSDGYILTYNGVNYTADDLFGNYNMDSTGAETMFNAVYKVAVRQYFTDEAQKEALTVIENNTKNKVQSVKDEATTNKTTNGTTWDEEWNKLLDSHGVENEQELYDKFEYEAMKEEFDDQFYSKNNNKNLNVLKNGGKFTNPNDNSATNLDEIDGYLNAKYPYHVKHILVKVGAESNNPTTGKITEAEARNLAEVIKQLAAGNLSFGRLAQLKSEDTESAKLYGDLGIMDLGTSYVNEFKLGVYLYDTLVNGYTKDEAAATDFTIPNEDGQLDYFTSFNDKTGLVDVNGNNVIGTIPYGAALALEEYADVEDNKGAEVANGNPEMYPRNIIFNKYFNKHNVSVIVPNTTSTVNYQAGTDGVRDTTSTESFIGTFSNEYAALPGFNRTSNYGNNAVEFEGLKFVDDNGNEINPNKQVLRDESGRVILAVRAGTGSGEEGYQGIHFIVIERSPFAEVADNVSLEDYWTYYYPTEADYPKDSDGKPLKTYVNYIAQTTKDYKERAGKVESAIKGYDSNVNSYIYKTLVETEKLEFSDSAQGKMMNQTINTYIDSKFAKAEIDEATTWEETWKTYMEYLQAQYAARGADQLISETCALKYLTNSNDDMFTKPGGMCYAKKA